MDAETTLGNFKPLNGKRFNRWVVLSLAEEKSRHKHAAYWNCRCDCGTRRIVRGGALTGNQSQSCGCLSIESASQRMSVKREQHPAWKGGRQEGDDGYVRIFVGRENDPRHRKYVLEHVLVMERKLGRLLLPDETVHHKNGIRDDNSKDNLELRVRAKHPSGASVEDLLAWAHELIERYENKSSSLSEGTL